MTTNGKPPAASLKLAGVAHDLNNIFQTLISVATELEEVPGTAALSGAILRSVERGQRLVAALQDSPAEPAPLEQVLSNAKTFIEDRLRISRRPALQITYGADPHIELSDPWAWERVFINLFLNSARAMTRGGTIHVEAHLLDNKIEITVTDEGPGISNEMLEHLFEPYISSNGSTGLGLSIVEGVVRANGGQITASNRNGKPGATFSITLPAQTAVDSERD
jgi:signal transduction histidine kinase